MDKVGRKKIPLARPVETRQQIDGAICQDGPTNVREILRANGHPLERILKDVLIPKLSAKKIVTVPGPRGAIQIRLVDDNVAQIKASVELLRMCGCYGSLEIGASAAAAPEFDCQRWSDDDLETFLALAAKNK